MLCSKTAFQEPFYPQVPHLGKESSAQTSTFERTRRKRAWEFIEIWLCRMSRMSMRRLCGLSQSDEDFLLPDIAASLLYVRIECAENLLNGKPSALQNRFG